MSDETQCATCADKRTFVHGPLAVAIEEAIYGAQRVKCPTCGKLYVRRAAPSVGYRSQTTAPVPEVKWKPLEGQDREIHALLNRIYAENDPALQRLVRLRAELDRLFHFYGCQPIANFHPVLGKAGFLLEVKRLIDICEGREPKD